MREITIRRVILRRVRSRDQRIEGHVMVRQQQALRRKKLARAAVNDHYGVLDARPVRIINIGDRNLEPPLLQLLQRKFIEHVGQEHAFLAQRGQRNETDEKQN